ncbi:hypothetical protein A4X09_0g1164 [Tilletia walkeri]|uniref:CCAAT-binding factor domain-containing protein n=1 Tax=Tilletia walkeri TaxID=117179 RepID=A0A8X7NER5_9BASI|nr:hypothetical protein A4X09_0g1164 [Tilletia walkeri]
MPRRDFRPKDKPAKAKNATAGGRGGRPSGDSSQGGSGRRPPPPAQQQQQEPWTKQPASGSNHFRNTSQTFSKPPASQGNKVVFEPSGNATTARGPAFQGKKGGKPQAAASEDGETDDDDDDDAGGRNADQDSLLDDDDMMAEIEALGGDKSDLELIKDVRTGASSSVPADDDPSLKTDLQSFLKQLNLPSVAPGPFVDPDQKPAAEAEKSKKPKKEKEAAQSVVKSEEVDSKQKKTKEPTEKASKKKEKDVVAKAADVEASKAQKAPAKVIFQPAAPSLLGADSAWDSRDGLALQVTPLWSQTSLPKLEAAPPSSEKLRRKAKAANMVIQHAALSDEHIASLEHRASKLLERENATYARMFEAEATGTVNHKSSLAAAGSNISASDARFIRSLLSTSGEGGTLSDRISALTLLLQSSPLHNLRPLDNLMAMVRKKNREESGRASRALSDWFSSDSGLPSDRKLRYFRDQEGLANVAFVLSDANPSKDTVAAAEKHLVVFAFEHRLKNIFFEFLLLLEGRSHDALAFARTSAVIQMSNLLSRKAEQEQNLLRLLVNKLGDGERSVASKASNALLELLNSHPGMKSIVVREVADLVLKPAASMPSANTSASQSKGPASKEASADAKKYNSHARYYGVLTLNQTMITSQDRVSGLSNALVNLYFELFEGILEDMDSGNASGSGAAGKDQKLGAGGDVQDPEDDDDEEESAKPKQKNRWRDQGGKRRKKGKQQQVSNGGKEINAVVKDAEAKIVAALLTGVRRAMPFATLETAVFERHIDTLFRITHSGTFNISIQALQLIFQVCTSVPGGGGSNKESTFTASAALADRYYRALYASLMDQRLEETSKQAMYLNLLFRSMKVDALAPKQEDVDGEDSQAERLKAFSKRLVQVLGHHQPPFVCGALFMLGELSKLSGAIRGMLTVAVELPSPLTGENGSEAEDEDGAAALTAKKVDGGQHPNTYDGLKRDPRYAHAGATCLWELLPLLTHYHPSVALHAQQLLDGTPISATADLNSSSLSHFLDRFVFRNPKLKAPSAKGASIMQPGFGTGTGSMASGVGADDVNVVNLKGRGVNKDEDVMNPKFWKRDRDDVPVDQVFFHQYFQQKQAREKGSTSSAAGKGKGKGSEKVAEEDETKALLNDDGADKDDAENSDAEADQVLDEDELGEDEIWEAIVNALPEAGDVDDLEDSGDSDDDSDGSGVEGFNAEDFSDDEELDAMLGRGDDDVDDDDTEAEDALLQEDDDAESDGDDSSDADEDDQSGDVEEDADEAGDIDHEDEDDDESLDIELLEDEDDLLSLDGGSESDDESDSAAVPAAPTSAKRKDKRKREAEEEPEETEPTAKLSNREKRMEKKKRKALPTFASADDYAHLLGSDDEDA